MFGARVTGTMPHDREKDHGKWSFYADSNSTVSWQAGGVTITFKAPGTPAVFTDCVWPGGMNLVVGGGTVVAAFKPDMGA